MSLADLDFNIIFGAINTGAITVFVILFAKGVILPLNIVEKILRERDKGESKLAKEIGDKMQKNMKNAIVEAIYEVRNGKGGRSS